MTVMTQASGGGRSGSLYDVIELILDRGLVIDAFVRVSLLGIEVLTVEARVVVASVDTYLRFAETASRLELTAVPETRTRTKTKKLPELVEASPEETLDGLSKGLVEGRSRAPRGR